MRHQEETAQRGNAGGQVNHRQKEPTTLAARGARGSRRFGPNLGELILIALALGAASRTFAQVQR